MADENVNVVYTADTSQYVQSLNEATQATERYAEMADNVAGKIGKIGITTAKAIQGFGSVFGKPTQMTAATQTAAAYERQLSLISARAKVAGQNVAQLNRDVRAVARDFPIGIGGAQQQFQVIQQAGKTGTELTKITREMVKLGAATGDMTTDMTQSMVQFTRTFKQFEPGKVEDMSDAVVQLSSSFGASAGQILDFGNTIAPLAKQLGMGETSVLGFSAAFARAGESGARSANIFNQMQSDMERAIRTGAPNVKSYAEALGMTSQQFVQLAKADPTEAMTRFFESITSQGSDGIRILEDLGFEGVRSMKAITQVAETGGIREAVKTATQAYGAGATGMVAGEAFKGLADSMDRTRESMTQLVEASGRPMLGMMSGISDMAADATSGMAGLVNSPAMQTLITGGLILKGFAGGAGTLASIGQAKGGVGWAAGAIGRGTERLVGSPIGQQIAANRGMLMSAGAAGAAAGLMMGDPKLMLGSMAAYMLLSNGPSFVGRLRGISNTGINAFFNDPRQLVPVQQGLMGQQMVVSSRTFSAGARLQQWRAGLLPGERIGPDISGGRWSAQRVIDLEERIQQSNAAHRAALMYGSRGAMARSGVAAAGMMGLNLLSMLGPLASLPGLALMGTAGAGYLGYKAVSGAKEIRESSESELSRFSQATGIATKGLEQLASTLSTLESSAHTMGDAMKVTAADIAAGTSAAYEAALPEDVYGKGTPEEIAQRLFVTYGYQSPNMVQRAKTDLISMNRTDVDEIFTEFDRLRKDQSSPIMEAMRMNQEVNKDRSLWETLINPSGAPSNKLAKAFEDLITSDAGKREQVEQARAAGINQRQRYAELEESLGTEHRNQMILTKGLDNVLKYIDMSANYQIEHDALIEAVGGELGLTDEKSQEVLDLIKDYKSLVRSTEGKTGQQFIEAVEHLGVGGAGELAGVAKSMGMTAEALQEFIKKQGRLPTLAEILTAQNGALEQLGSQTDSLINKSFANIKGLAQAGAFGAEELKKAFEVATQNLQSPAELYQEEKKLRAEGMAGQLTVGEFTALGAYVNPEDAGKIAAEAFSAQLKAMSEIGGGGGMQTRMSNVMGMAAELYKKGEFTPGVEKLLTNTLDSFEHAIEAMANNEISITEAREQQREADMDVISNIQRSAGGSFIISDQGTIRDRQLSALQRQVARDQEILGRNREFLMQVRQQQMGAGLQRTEFGISAGIARRDAGIQEERQRTQMALNASRARDDQIRSEARAWDDYYTQLSRSRRDFDKQMQRSQDDFAREMARAADDFRRQEEHAWEDYYRQVERSTLEFVTNMTDPNSRMAVGRVWSAQGMAANLAEQTQLIEEQFDIIDDLRERGLQQEVIDVLGLANPANAMQTRSLIGMSQADIDALNAQMAARGEIGQRAYEEQLGTRYAEEDILTQLARSRDEFDRQTARSLEDFARSMAHTTEDFHTSIEDMYSDLTKNLARANEDLERSLARSVTDLETSLGYMWEDLNRSLADSQAALERSIANSRDMLIASYEDIVMSAEQSMAMVDTALAGGFVDFTGMVKSKLDETLSGISAAVDAINPLNIKIVLSPDSNQVWNYQLPGTPYGMPSPQQWNYTQPGTTYGRSSGAGSAAASGTGNNPNAMAARFEDEIGNTKMYTKKHGFWSVYQACLKNVGNEWEDMGNSVKRYPTAISKALMLDKTPYMNHDYNAPRGALYWWKNSPFGHVSVADGFGNAINNYGGNRVERTPVRGMLKSSYVGWTMPAALALSNGGILRGTTMMAGEGGPEMYLPLDSRGARFLNDLLSKYQANGEVRQARTAGYSVVHNVNASTTVHDSSVHTGTVTVVSADPDDMARKLRAKARQSALASKV